MHMTAPHGAQPPYQGMQSPAHMQPQPYQPPAAHGYPAQPFAMPPGPPVVQHPFGVPQRSTRSFDMARMAAREATIRKLVWIIVLVVGTGVGIIIATQL
jgi:hypothetical protein